MTPERFEEIQEIIEEKKETKIRAQSTMENIEEDWETNHDIHSSAEAETMISKLGEEIKGLEEKEKKVEEELETLMGVLE